MAHIEASTIKNNFSLWQAVGLSGDSELAEYLLEHGFYRVPMGKWQVVNEIMKTAEVKCSYKYMADKIVTKPQATHFSVFLKKEKRTK